MKSIIDPVSGLPVGDPSYLDEITPPSDSQLCEALDTTILSVSGWRKIFVQSGDEEDSSPRIAAVDYWLAAAMALSFGRNLPMLCNKSSNNIVIAVGMDSRPTGPAVANAMMRVLIGLGFELRYVFIAAVPEIMAYAATEDDIDAFCYISASHNPIGHNGVKFGLNKGGVLNAEEIKPLIDDLKDIVNNGTLVAEISALFLSVDKGIFSETMTASFVHKKTCLAAYKDFADLVTSAQNDAGKIKESRAALISGIKKNPLGIVADLNGSARTLSIDENYLSLLGIKLRIINGGPREIAHRIIPEGESLNQCLRELETAHKADKNFVLGYVPDNDGDRGNIVYIDGESGRALALEAQEVFALSCVAEMAGMVQSGALQYGESESPIQPAAIVVNDPTSLRIEEIAAAFGAEVFRAEVGEANVVNLAKKKRDEGYLIRILGEGSNGGNITHPSAVRDPLNTVVALVKLLCVLPTDDSPGIFQIWCRRRGIAYKEPFDMSDVIKTLPAYRTTPVSEERAIFGIKSTNHAELKKAYETVFTRVWDNEKESIKKRFGFEQWQEINYETTNERKGFGPSFRSGLERGGFKILFKDAAGKNAGFVWMRGSGTEPVFRVLADWRGESEQTESDLLDWHRNILAQADALALTV